MMKVPIRAASYRSNHTEEKIEYANFNQTRIITLFQVPQYDHLQILVCNGNALTTLAGIENIKHLWKLDVGNNQIRSLQHLSRFIALGSLILSNNQLPWIELQHIRHMLILDLRIDGNPILDADPNYRQHVLDCLPRIWMCDGVFVSTEERNQVDEFFTQSSLTSKPVRRKLAKDIFMPTNLKDRTVNGLFGTKATELFAKFPINCFITPELDRKRIKHLASTIQDIFSIEMKYTDEKKWDSLLTENRHLLNQMVDLRQNHIEQFNMFLILLLTDILYHIPETLLEHVLNLTQIKSIGNLNIPHLFTCSEPLKCTLASLVHAGARVDRDENHPSAIYDKLFQSLSIVLHSQVRQLSNTSATNATYPNSALLSESKSLLCLEVMQVFIMCPLFYTLTNDSSVTAIINQALDRSPASESVRNVLGNLQADEKTAEEKRDLLSPTLSNILKMTIRTLSSKRTKKMYETVVIIPETYASDTERSMPPPPSEPEPLPSSRKSSRAASHRVPAIGDRILAGPQSFGRIVTLPDADLAMVQMDHVLAVNGSMVSHGTLSDHTTYVTINNFEWNPAQEYWRPKSSHGDRVTLQMTTARIETPRATVPIQMPSTPVPASPPKSLPRRTAEFTARRPVSTPKRTESSIVKSKDTFVEVQRPATPASPPPSQPAPPPAPALAEVTEQTNSQVLPKSPPPTPPASDQKITVIKDRSRERPMSVRIIKQKQERTTRESVNGENFTSAPVLIESMLLLMPDQPQAPIVSYEQIQPALQSSTTITDLEALRAASLFDHSAMPASLMTSDRHSAIQRVHVPIHNASQWFNGPDLQNERVGRMEKVVASLIRRPFRPVSSYAIPRVPTLSSPSSKDHAYYRGVRPESFQDFRVETQRLTPVPTSVTRMSPHTKGRYLPSPTHHYPLSRFNDPYQQSLTRVKSLLNPPRSTPTYM